MKAKKRLTKRHFAYDVENIRYHRYVDYRGRERDPT